MDTRQRRVLDRAILVPGRIVRLWAWSCVFIKISYHHVCITPDSSRELVSKLSSLIPRISLSLSLSRTTVTHTLSQQPAPKKKVEKPKPVKEYVYVPLMTDSIKAMLAQVCGNSCSFLPLPARSRLVHNRQHNHSRELAIWINSSQSGIRVSPEHSTVP